MATFFGAVIRHQKPDAPAGVQDWVFVGPAGNRQADNVLPLLTTLASEGWEVVGIGDFIGSMGDEILLKK